MKCGKDIRNKMRKALVSGCNRGIGLAITEKFLEEGFFVIGTYRTLTKEIEVLQDRYRDKLQLHIIDFSYPEDLEIFYAKILQHEMVDTLVNNASMSQRKPFLELTDEDWTQLFNVNLFSAIKLTKFLLPQMKDRKFGRIINITSVAGQSGGVHQVHYAAAKAGLINFTKSLTRSFSEFGINSNCISPGAIDTEMIAPELPKTREEYEDFLKAIPMRRLGSAREVAEVAFFLASNKATYITGQSININGGTYLG